MGPRHHPLNHDITIERAEAVRLWLLGLRLSSRASSAIQRELRAIIDDDASLNGQRPLARLLSRLYLSS